MQTTTDYGYKGTKSVTENRKNSKKNDTNSYRLGYAIPQNADNEIAFENKFNFPASAPIFIEHRLLKGLEQRKVAAFLNHTQELLVTAEVVPVWGSVLDNTEHLKDRHVDDLVDIIAEIFSSLNRSHESIRRDLSFILQFDVEKTQRLLPLNTLWALWKKHGKKASKSRSKDMAKHSVSYAPVDYVLREEFFPDHNVRHYQSKRNTELDACYNKRRSMNPRGQLHYSSGVKASHVLQTMSVMMTASDQKLFELDRSEGDETMATVFRDLLDDSEYYAVKVFKKMMAVHKSPEKVLSHMRKMNADEIFSWTILDNFPQIPQRRKEVRTMLARNMDDFITTETRSVLKIRNLMNDHRGHVSPKFIEKMTGVSVPFELNHKSPWGYNLLCTNNSGDLNYVVTLLIQNLEPGDVVDLISYFYGKGHVDVRTLPTVTQWERFVKNHDDKFDGLPPEVGIEMSSRKRNA